MTLRMRGIKLNLRILHMLEDVFSYGWAHIIMMPQKSAILPNAYSLNWLDPVSSD